MRRPGIAALLALSCGTAIAAAPVQARQFTRESSAACEVSDGDAIDVVLLVDQSKSLAKRLDPSDRSPDAERDTELLQQLSDGVGKVADTLGFAVEDELVVSLGIIEFSSTTFVSRELSPFASSRELFMARQRLLDTSNLGNDTDYVQALLSATKMFAGSTSGAECRILIWFTDGVAEPQPFRSENLDVSDSTYVQRVTSQLLGSVCGSEGEIPVAAALHDLGVVTYALMINDDVETWLSLEPGAGSALDASRAVRFRSSLDVMRAVTGDRSPELGGASPPDITSICSPFLEGGPQGPAVAGDVVAESGKLAEYLFFAIGSSLNPGSVGECPNEVTQMDGTWESEELPPGAKFARMAVIVLDGELSTANSVNIRTPEGERTIALEPSGYLSSSELNDVTSPWRFSLAPSADVESVRFCVQYKLRPLRTEQLRFIPTDLSAGSEGAAIGEATLEFAIDWSPLRDGDGLEPTEYLQSVLVESPVGPVTVSSNFGIASLDVTAMPDTSDGADREQLLDQFEVTLIPRSRLEPESSVIGVVDPAIPLRHNEDAPVLECSGEKTTRFTGESAGTAVVSDRQCTVVAPRSGVATISLTSVGTVESGDVRWFPVGQDGAVLDERIQLTDSSPDLLIRYSTQELTVDRGWSGSGFGDVTVEWSNNDSRQTDEFGFEVLLLPPPDNTLKWILVAAFMFLAVAVSLILLWLIGRLLFRLPRGSNFYFRQAAVEFVVPAASGDERANAKFADSIQDALENARQEPGRDAKGRGELPCGPYTLRRHLPLWPPFAMPEITVSPSNMLRALPNGSTPDSIAAQFDSILLLQVRSLDLVNEPRVTVHATLMYPAGPPDTARFFKQRVRIIDDSTRSLITDAMASRSSREDQPAGHQRPADGDRDRSVKDESDARSAGEMGSFGLGGRGRRPGGASPSAKEPSEQEAIGGRPRRTPSVGGEQRRRGGRNRPST